MIAPRVLARAARLLWRERSLWPWAALPFLLNALAFGLAAALFVTHLDSLAAPVERVFDVARPSAWYGWLVVGPLLLFAKLVRALLLVALALAIYATFTLVGGIIAAPFLDSLSARVERLATGREPAQEPGFAAALRRAGRSVREEAKRVAFFVASQLACIALGLIPGLQPLAAGLSLAFSALFLPLVYTGFALDRRGVPFAARRRWVTSHALDMLGFGGVALALFLVPGLSFLSLPWLVSAGTLLVVELGAPGSGA
jgi:CysZ protein